MMIKLIHSVLLNEKKILPSLSAPKKNLPSLDEFYCPKVSSLLHLRMTKPPPLSLSSLPSPLHTHYLSLYPRSRARSLSPLALSPSPSPSPRARARSLSLSIYIYYRERALIKEFKEFQFAL